MIDIIWNSLLELKNLLSACDYRNFSAEVTYTDLNFYIQVSAAEAGQTPEIIFNFPEKNSWVAFFWDNEYNLEARTDWSDDPEVRFIRTYLPYCFSTLKSHQLQRAYGISHHAQSLDGKIATLEGNSKWISQPEDLVHCHRMRALCDGILIGINTLRLDHPSLNVRHVKGNNPVKIVLGSTSASFSSLLQNNGGVIQFTTSPAKSLPGIRQIILPASSASPVFIMQSLYAMGIHSVFIEGGSKTASSFLEHEMIDEVQLYLSPSLFGSGLPNFSLPVIRKVEEAVVFSRHEFLPMGKGILFKGEVKRYVNRNVNI
jgi:diaminohydroxyphosphoribosylaminopyrimidine deaminase/5-amino-6-(5-phosphoribosylamino)uracil reductase